MTSIDHANLSRLDLNLLVAFDALLSERSVTRAAARLGLGQSAMSHNLGRLRVLFGDELLTRGAEGMRPTPRALALADPVRVTLSQIQAAVLQREAFDPSTADRTFRIGLADSIEVAIIPGLLARLRSVAPAVSFSIVLTTPGFLAVPFVVRRAPVITTMPSRLARYFAEAFGLAASPAPIELPTFTISLLWHASFDQDPGHLWLRQTVSGLASEVGLEL